MQCDINMDKCSAGSHRATVLPMRGYSLYARGNESQCPSDNYNHYGAWMWSIGPVTLCRVAASNDTILDQLPAGRAQDRTNVTAAADDGLSNFATCW